MDAEITPNGSELLRKSYSIKSTIIRPIPANRNTRPHLSVGYLSCSYLGAIDFMLSSKAVLRPSLTSALSINRRLSLDYVINLIIDIIP